MNIRTRFASAALLAVGVGLIPVAPARASLIISIESVSANAGSVGNALEVSLSNTGPSAVTVGGFGFQVTTSDTDITFTSTDIATTLFPYIFVGNSLFGPIINFDPPGQSMDGTDLPATGPGTSIASGVSVGLGRVLFDVAPGAASGSFAVSLDPFPTTNVSGPAPDFANLPLDTPFTPGQITITGTTAVPEPTSALLLGGALLCLGLKKRRQVPQALRERLTR